MTPRYTIILAAGKGTRMHSDQLPKVCFEVNGVPAIVRAMRTYRAVGCGQFLVVVGGPLAGKVMETVGAEFPNTVYAFQPIQNGTAGAVQAALGALTTIGDDEDLLIVAGDRLIERNLLEQLFEHHRQSGAAFTLLALRSSAPSTSGRILFTRDGTPLAIVEMADIRQRRAYARMQQALADGKTANAVLFRLAAAEFADPRKGAKAFGPLWEHLSTQEGNITPEDADRIRAGKCAFSFDTPDGPVAFTPDEAEASAIRNISVYLVKCGLLRQALATFTRDNAQQEIYLPDLLHAAYRMGLPTAVLPESDATKILGFNNPQELLEVEKTLSNRAGRRTPAPGLLKTLPEWRKLFDDAERPGTPFHRKLAEIYGDDAEVIARQSAEMRRLADAAETRFAPGTPLLFVRAPGRLNAMGRHVDHQGGNCNLMTISFETMLFAAPRDDSRITLAHCDPDDFPPASFDLAELLAELPWEDWGALVNSQTLARRFKDKGIGWTDYVQAAILRIQKKFKDAILSGMDLLVSGNIPMAAGLSSSSSLVVAATEAVVRLNALDTFPTQFITLCGEGEWFVGTHGGSSDHAAVKLGACGAVTRVRFFDFALERTVPFPEGCQMLVCDSGIKARKSSNAKDQFNHRVSCYRLGFELIRRHYPQYAGVLGHLRDVNTRTLHVPLRDIYRMLLMLPENPARAELEEMLPGADFQTLFAGHDARPDRRYPIRGVVLYGLAEMQRAAQFADLLANADLPRIGEMMAASHDGDRVTAYDENFHPRPWHPAVDNAALLRLLDDLDSGDLERVRRAQLDRQTGSYACSIPEIDLMVDIARRTPGVIGAQLAGAGLGGCMMILARQDAIPDITHALTERYYRPASIPPRILACRPVAGAGAL